MSDDDGRNIFTVYTGGDEHPECGRPVELTRARERYQRATGACDHYRYTVDEELAEVLCRDCGARLNPINVLCRLADRETRFARRIETLRWETKRYDAKSRTTCEHCGKQTRVRPGKPLPGAQQALATVAVFNRLPEETDSSGAPDAAPEGERR